MHYETMYNYFLVVCQLQSVDEKLGSREYQPGRDTNQRR